MPILLLNQSNSAASIPNAGCSGRSLTAASKASTICTYGDPFFNTAFGIFMSSSETNVVTHRYKCIIPARTVWAAGTWTWRLNVTTANMNMTLTEVYICRTNSSDVNQATIGSATALGISLSTTGVKSGNITGSAQTNSLGDYVSIMFVMTNGAMSAQNIGHTADQQITTPFITQRVSPISVGHPFIT